MREPDQPTPKKPSFMGNHHKELIMPCRLHGLVNHARKFRQKLSEWEEAFQETDQGFFRWLNGSYLASFGYPAKINKSGAFPSIGVLQFQEGNKFTLTVNSTERAILALRFFTATFRPEPTDQSLMDMDPATGLLRKKIDHTQAIAVRFDSLDWYKKLHPLTDKAFIERFNRLSTFFDGLEIAPPRNPWEEAKARMAKGQLDNLEKFLDDFEKEGLTAGIESIDLHEMFGFEKQIAHLQYTFDLAKTFLKQEIIKQGNQGDA